MFDTPLGDSGGDTRGAVGRCVPLPALDHCPCSDDMIIVWVGDGACDVKPVNCK